jgi:hypothetical protein
MHRRVEEHRQLAHAHRTGVKRRAHEARRQTPTSAQRQSAACVYDDKTGMDHKQRGIELEAQAYKVGGKTEVTQRAAVLPLACTAMFYLRHALDTRDRSTLARRATTTPRSPCRTRTRLPVPQRSAALHATAQQKTCAPNKTQNSRDRTVSPPAHIQCAPPQSRNAHPAGTRHRHTQVSHAGLCRTTRNRTNFAWPTRRTPYWAAASRPRGGPCCT